ncbi:hypothetical protein [Variovorax paradoxus]|uniref:hypothetical protein n=1 Tax=Variovorax paradoxus TaxID=34073 RepID=UPI001932E620|nr:hypothetical protein INQ48_43060 [Variovorax paradoxus]
MTQHTPITDSAATGAAGVAPAPSEAHRGAVIVIHLDDDLEVVGACISEAQFALLLDAQRVLRVEDAKGAPYDIYLDMDQQTLVCDALTK